MEPQFDTVFGRAKDDLDDALQRMKEVAEKLNRGPGGRELAIAITNAETARLVAP